MKPHLTFAIALSLGAASFSTASFAGNSNAARGMTTHATVCPATAPALRSWARQTSGHGSFAVPYIAGARAGSCDSFVGYFPSSQSYGHKDGWLADQAALNHCEARKPAGFSGCLIVARSFPLK